MYKTFLIIFSVAFGLGQQTYKSIHQAELEYNKENFLEPLYKPYNGPANPKSKIKKNLTKKVFLDIILIGKEQNGNTTITIYFQQ